MLLKLLHANAPSRCSHPHGPSIPAPAGRAAPAQVVEPAILTPAVPAPERRSKSAGCARKAAPATPAAGALSSESAVHALQRLRLRLTPAQTVPVCLWCPTCSASARLSSGPSHPSVTRSTVWTLQQFNCHCHFGSPNSLAVSYWKTPSLQPYIAVFLIDYSNLSGPTEGRQLNWPTT